MKLTFIFVSVLTLLFQPIALRAFCCNGDGCPYSLARYVDDKGNPTGKYALLDEDNKPLQIKTGPDCACVKGIGKAFPAKTCPHCLEALCPRPDCGHHIFQHTCSLNVRAEHGTGIIELRETGEVEAFGEVTKSSK